MKTKTFVVTDEELEADKLYNEAQYQKYKKSKKLKQLKITTNNVMYNGDSVAQDNMTSVTAIANWQFNLQLKNQMQLILDDPESSTDLKQIALTTIGTYNAVYKDNKVEWKTAEDTISNVQVESIATTLHKVMLSKGEIITGDTR